MRRKMMFIIGLVLTLAFCGCQSSQDAGFLHAVNKSADSVATPQKADDSKPKEKFATSVKFISDVDKFEAISEKVYLDEMLSIMDILDREEVFL